SKGVLNQPEAASGGRASGGRKPPVGSSTLSGRETTGGLRPPLARPSRHVRGELAGRHRSVSQPDRTLFSPTQPQAKKEFPWMPQIWRGNMQRQLPNQWFGPHEVRHGYLGFRVRAYRGGIPRPAHDGFLGAGALQGRVWFATVRPRQPCATVHRDN